MKTMIRIIAIIILLLNFNALYVSASSGYEITDYDVHINVSEGNIYHVTETITINFHQLKHGILREIPTSYKDSYSLVSNINVEDASGKNIPIADQAISRHSTSIKIGSETELLKGEQVYIIQYDYNVGDDKNTSMDSMTYNLIGDTWDVTVKNITFTIEMPSPISRENLNFYAGQYGSTNTSHINYQVDGSRITGQVTKDLIHEFLTIDLILPEGYFSYETPKIHYWGFDHLLYQNLLLVVFVALLATYFMFKNQLTRDVVTEVPNGLNPCEILYIYENETFTINKLAVFILYWANQGYIRISSSGTTMRLHKLRDMDEEKKGYEKILYKGIFEKAYNNEVSTKTLEPILFDLLKDTAARITLQFHGDKEILVNSVQRFVKFAKAIYLGVQVCILTYFLTELSGLPFSMVLFAIVVFFTLSGVGLYSIYCLFRKDFGTEEKLSFVPVLLVSVGISYFVGALIKEVFYVLYIQNPLWIGSLLVVYLVLIILGYLFVKNIRLYTPYGRELRSQILGFRRYIKDTAIEDMNSALKENPNYIDELLPYAIVLGLSSKWKVLMKSYEPNRETSKAHVKSRFLHYHYFYRLPRRPRPIYARGGLGQYGKTSRGVSGGFRGGGGGFSGGGRGGGGGSSW